VDAHLEALPRLRTLSTRRLASRDSQRFCRHTHRSLDFELLVLGGLDELI